MPRRLSMRQLPGLNRGPSSAGCSCTATNPLASNTHSRGQSCCGSTGPSGGAGLYGKGREGQRQAAARLAAGIRGSPHAKYCCILPRMTVTADGSVPQIDLAQRTTVRLVVLEVLRILGICSAASKTSRAGLGSGPGIRNPGCPSGAHVRPQQAAASPGTLRLDASRTRCCRRCRTGGGARTAAAPWRQAARSSAGR